MVFSSFVLFKKMAEQEWKVVESNGVGLELVFLDVSVGSQKWVVNVM